MYRFCSRIHPYRLAALKNAIKTFVLETYIIYMHLTRLEDKKIIFVTCLQSLEAGIDFQ